ncbi:hypothetical protein Cflav_PD4269 [Pedosphaera parvula Ellin514]|uniref:DUF7305 domain-containing protein n=2 Tax=Pedosphaera TaxID=1032526 RepID=B9XF92_PEDPL|nr:hypothetical protein Cflav_PD4269 [Pedosphaera parvula Ellin514]
MWISCFKAGMWLVVCVVVTLVCGRFSVRGEDAPFITRFVRTNSQPLCWISYTNCSDRNFDYFVQSSSNLVDWVDTQAVRGSISNRTVIRSVVIASPKQSFHRIVKTPHINVPMFSMAIQAGSNITFMGNGIVIDSFDSSSSVYSSWSTNSLWGTNLVYDILKRNDHGDVGTDSSLTDSAMLGNAAIYGKLHTGPGSSTATAQIGANGIVGDLAFQAGGGNGFQTNAWLYDMNVAFTPVVAPSGPALPAPSYSTYSNIISVFNFNQADQLYVLNQPLNGQVVVSAPNVVIWAKAGINFSGTTGGLFIAPGAGVVIYVGDNSGSSVSVNLNGQGGVNANGYAKNCQIYGMTTCTSIDMVSYAAFVGTIYAPNADLRAGSGGNNTADSSGAIIAKSITLSGHWNFHYDENLKNSGLYW